MIRITAKEAASSLLSKWAGFVTFEEAVQNTISNNQEFIDRDTAIRSETADLKKKIVTTFPAKDASGAVATFESEFEDAPLKSCIVRVEPVQDLHGYDSPWPAGGGKNLLDPSLLKDQSAWNIIPVKVKPDTIYTMSSNVPVGTGLSVYFNNVNAGGGTSNNSVYTGHPISITSTSNGYVYASQRKQSGEDSFQNYHYQIEEGSTATAWTPYENICPITGWEGVEIQHDGTNLFDGEMENGDIVGGHNSGTSSSRYRSKNYIPITAGFYYFHSPNRTGSVRVFAYDENKEYLGFVAWNVNAINEIVNAKYIRFRFSTAKVDGDEQISINSPSSVTEYVPYIGRTYPITFPTEAGTVYGAYVYVTGGELVVDRAIFTLDGSTLKFANVYNRGTKKAFGISISGTYHTNADGKVLISNMLTWTSDWYTSMPDWTYGSVVGVPSNHIFAFDDTVTTIEEANALLSEWNTEGNPLTVTLLLATPIHYPLTPTEIKTLLGTNNVWANTGDTAVEYLMSDVSWYVEKKLKAFQSVLAGVEDSAVASKNYLTNSYLIFNDDIYRVTKAITAGETIEEGVNVTKTTVAEQLMALAQA